jgi:uncharacterized membrane protein
MRRKSITTILFSATLLAALLAALPAFSSPGYAQSIDTSGDPVAPLTISTAYPSEVVGIGENVSISLNLATGADAQVVDLEVQDVPEGWDASFKGGTHLVQSVYVKPDEESTVELKLAVPASVEPGAYDLEVVANGEQARATLPLELIVQEKVPASLSLSADLPTLRGKPDGTFRYNATLKNEGDEDLNVDLLADAPTGFTVKFSSGGQDVTTLPLEANATKSVSVEVSPLYKMDAGDYPVNVQAQAGEAQASLALTAEVVGESDVSLTTPDSRLSGDVQAGKDTTISLLLENTGSAAAEAITMSATAPNGWTVDFEPKEVPELAAGSQIPVTAHVQPADKAIAGDYVISFSAQPKDSSIESIDYRATVRTSTLWGITGIALIALAVAVVGLAVNRFGRR